MLYQLDDEIISISSDEISRDILTFGYVSMNELSRIYKVLGFSTQAFEECRVSELLFSPRLILFDNYALMRLDCDDLNCHVALFLSANLFIAVVPDGSHTSYRDIFISLNSRLSCTTATADRIACIFLAELMNSFKKPLEELQTRLFTLEAAVFSKSTDNDFNKSLLTIKEELLSYRGFYEQIIELCERLCENENELFTPDELMSFRSFGAKADRFKEKADLLRDSVNHIWDSYQAQLDIKLNESMKIFTLLTTIFFPMTIIVGWYGMNFKNMPELSWKYGYLYVILLAVAIVSAMFLWLKKRKWL